MVVEPLDLGDEVLERLESEFTLIFTGMSRRASSVLSESPEDEKDRLARLRTIRAQADVAQVYLESGDLVGLGALLEGAWQAKRGITASVSNEELDTLHDRILSLGASGAKLLGAGGGGFFLAHGDAGLRAQLTAELGDSHRIIPLDIDFDGSTIIHTGSE